MVQTDDANRKKADENFYKMDEESIVTIREDLADDFFSLDGAHLKPSKGWLKDLMMISSEHNFSLSNSNRSISGWKQKNKWR